MALLLVNSVMVGVIWYERTHFRLTKDQKTLMAYLRDLNPGEFWRLLKITHYRARVAQFARPFLGPPQE